MFSSPNTWQELYGRPSVYPVASAMGKGAAAAAAGSGASEAHDFNQLQLPPPGGGAPAVARWGCTEPTASFSVSRPAPACLSQYTVTSQPVRYFPPPPPPPPLQARKVAPLWPPHTAPSPLACENGAPQRGSTPWPSHADFSMVAPGQTPRPCTTSTLSPSFAGFTSEEWPPVETSTSAAVRTTQGCPVTTSSDLTRDWGGAAVGDGGGAGSLGYATVAPASHGLHGLQPTPHRVYPCSSGDEYQDPLPAAALRSPYPPSQFCSAHAGGWLPPPGATEQPFQPPTTWLPHATYGEESRSSVVEPVDAAAAPPTTYNGNLRSSCVPAPLPSAQTPPLPPPFLQQSKPLCDAALPVDHEYSSISEGARRLNSVHNRSAASASAFFFRSPTSADDYGCGLPIQRQGWRAGTHFSSSNAPTESTSATTTAINAATTAAAVSPSESCCVTALIFNSAKEVGVALCTLPSLTVSLLQYGDTATFYKTSSLLHTRNPVEVLVPSTAVDSELVRALLQQHSTHMTFTSVQRCFFNAEEGVQRLLQLNSSSETAAALSIEDTDRYLCVAAANAVVLYMEHVNDMHLLPGSVRVRMETLEHFMEVSRTTARALELIPDSACALVRAPPPLSAAPVPGEWGGSIQLQARRSGIRSTNAPTSFLHQSEAALPLQTVALIDALPRPCTVMGQRFLRRALLQPLRDRTAVQGRHDAVEWLVREPRRLYVLRALLHRTATLDVERMTATLTHQPRREMTDAQKRYRLESLLLLWNVLPHLDQLRTQLALYLGPTARAPTDEEPGEADLRSPLSPLAKRGTRSPPPPPRPTPASRTVAETGSTADYPLVLHSITAALQKCRFADLSALMGTVLDKSMLPAVVGYHEQQLQEQQGYGVRQPRGAPPDVLPSPTLSATTTNHPDPWHPQQGRRRRRNGRDVASASSPPLQQQRSAAVLLRLLRMCFLVQASRGGELDALRTRLSIRIAEITDYVAELRATYQISSLRLEPDPVKLYCLSYTMAEAAKARAAPFTWQYSGGSHFALYLAALREQQQQQQQRQGHDHRRQSDRSAYATSNAATVLSSSSTSPMALSGFASGNDESSEYFSRDRVSPLLSPNVVSDGAASSAKSLRRRVRCSTEDLEYRCARAQECVTAILQEQLRGVQPLVLSVQQHFLGALQATVESVALLDTLVCFACYTVTHSCVRPILVDLKTGLTTMPATVTCSSSSAGHPEDGGPVPPMQGKTLQGNEKEADLEAAGSGDGDDTTTTERGSSSEEHAYSESLSPTSTPGSTLLTNSTTRDKVPSENHCDRRHASRLSLFVRCALHPSAAPRPSSRPPPPPRAQIHSTFCSAGPLDDTDGGITLSWGEDGDVCVVTGPNACGKTTLLRILGQYITLAQAGCFLPARHAQLFLVDRLLAHMLCDELPSIAQSSFRRELMELNELTHAATAESLVLIDELGRSTTTLQGFSLAWATAVFLSERRVHSVLTTHYAGLPSLARARPGRIAAFHFRVVLQQIQRGERPSDETPANATEAGLPSVGSVVMETHRHVTILRFGHTLFPGPCPQRWYGLALAEKLHFFEPVLALARNTRACCLAEAPEGDAEGGEG